MGSPSSWAVAASTAGSELQLRVGSYQNGRKLCTEKINFSGKKMPLVFASAQLEANSRLRKRSVGHHLQQTFLEAKTVITVKSILPLHKCLPFLQPQKYSRLSPQSVRVPLLHVCICSYKPRTSLPQKLATAARGSSVVVAKFLVAVAYLCLQIDANAYFAATKSFSCNCRHYLLSPQSARLELRPSVLSVVGTKVTPVPANSCLHLNASVHFAATKCHFAATTFELWL